jgi:cell division inhibitor SepF
MASMWRKAMLYLGLGPDDEYEDYERAEHRPGSAQAQAAGQREPVSVAPREPGSTRSRPQNARSGGVRGGGTRPAPPQEPEQAAVRPIAPPDPPEPAPAKPRTVVRPVPAAARPHVVSPTSFNHAQELADKFKANQPVILNLQGVERELARRLIDFSSGLCYGLGGHMEKVAHQVYLLTPADVVVSAEERRRLSERGLHDA